jgi:GNAT superfamily N-acetyltransferase
MTVERAIETFVRGYCFTRSFTHPYVAERAGPLWVLRDGPRKSGDSRRVEFVSCGVAPAQVHRLIQQHSSGHYCICALHGPDEDGDELREGFKASGYRLGHSEALMAHALKRIPRAPAPMTIRRVDTQAMADRLSKAARSRQILPEHLGQDAPIRCYVALDGDAPIGWVSSIVVGDSTWCSNMYVKPEFRRRGIARSLLCRMLRDDRTGGADTAVLLASHAGAKLYPVVGYQPIGTLLVFTPKRKKA